MTSEEWAKVNVRVDSPYMNKGAGPYWMQLAKDYLALTQLTNNAKHWYDCFTLQCDLADRLEGGGVPPPKVVEWDHADIDERFSDLFFRAPNLPNGTWVERGYHPSAPVPEGKIRIHWPVVTP